MIEKFQLITAERRKIAEFCILTGRLTCSRLNTMKNKKKSELHLKEFIFQIKLLLKINRVTVRVQHDYKSNEEKSM